MPGVFGHLQPVLEHYGYLAVGGFVLLEDFGVPLPGETILIAAAIFAGSGHMNIAVVCLVAVVTKRRNDSMQCTPGWTAVGTKRGHRDSFARSRKSLHAVPCRFN